MFYSEAGREHGSSDERLNAIFNLDEKVLSPEEITIFRFSLKCALEPDTVTDAEIDKLRSMGYDDGQIVELVSVIAFVIGHNVIVSTFQIAPPD